MSLPPPLPGPPLSTPASASAPVRRGWWQRHWKWAVPMLVLLGLAIFAAGLFGLFSMSMGMMRNNDAYRVALAQARADRTLLAVLGTPIEPGWWMTGSIGTRGDGSGEAQLQIPVHGPRGEATLYVLAMQRKGVWRFSELAATVEGSTRPIDLLPGLPPERRTGADDADRGTGSVSGDF